MIQPERISILNNRPMRRGKYVLYLMQASQREEYNHALEYAVHRANEHKVPVVVVFGITDRFPEANLRHYTFMLEGLRETREALRRRKIQMVVLRRSPDVAALTLANCAVMLVVDRGYLRIQKRWRSRVAKQAPCLVVQVESDVVVPVEVASRKEEYSAATLRPKILKNLGNFLVPLKRTMPIRDSLGLKLGGVSIGDIARALSGLKIDRTVKPVETFKGGAGNAKRLLRRFISRKLKDYVRMHSEPSTDCVSSMSPYLHFGQISPLYVALEINEARGKSKKAKEAFLEELIVRRELSMNFVNYNDAYDTYDALPQWARKTLSLRRGDKREYEYSPKSWEGARTHDAYWNAAQREMLSTGKMHGYMRMYWGKKILQWTARPEEAFRIALYLNNKYELDGRDPNGFAGVAWCFGKHDRPWGGRPVFGNVRYMSASGLDRKFDMDAYIRKVENMSRGLQRR